MFLDDDKKIMSLLDDGNNQKNCKKKFAQRLKKYVQCIHREKVMICTASLLYINEK
jgi:hypothetical protein